MMTAPHPEPIREPVSAEHVAALAEVLEGHRASIGPISGRWHCACARLATVGHIRTGDLTTYDERRAEHDAHIAHAILASPAMRDLLAEERARALREAADAIDNGPTFPLPPSVISALIRERAEQEAP